MAAPFAPRELFPEVQDVANDALRSAARGLLAQLRKSKGVPKRFLPYVDDPVGFFRDILKVQPWARQAELLDAAGRFDRVLCRSGHKCGKSLSCVGLALWWVCTRPGARVILTAPTFRQVKDILWRELEQWYPAVQGALSGGDIPLDPATGIRLPNGGQIIGVSTSKKENLAGYSGPNQLFIVDEASGFPDDLYETIKGNSAGGAKIVAISNPTRTLGWFYEGFKTGTYDLRSANDNSIPLHRWRLLHISSEESPNVLAAANDNGVLIPGLARIEYIEEMREECGPDWERSSVYMVRVRGEFPGQTTDSVIGLWLVSAATARWVPADTAAALALAHDGELTIGVDVARFGGDETVLQPVRGSYAWRPTVLSKADGPTVAEAVVELARELRRAPHQRVRVAVDGIGVGAAVVDSLRVHPAAKNGEIVVIDVDVSMASDDGDHANLRAQLWFGLVAWLRDSGAIPDDDHLTSELLAPTYTFDTRGRKKVASKAEMRLVLKRSPDRADALCLAVYRGKGRAYAYESADGVEGLRQAKASGGYVSGGRGRGRGAI